MCYQRQKFLSMPLPRTCLINAINLCLLGLAYMFPQGLQLFLRSLHTYHVPGQRMSTRTSSLTLTCHVEAILLPLRNQGFWHKTSCSLSKKWNSCETTTEIHAQNGSKLFYQEQTFDWICLIPQNNHLEKPAFYFYNNYTTDFQLNFYVF